MADVPSGSSRKPLAITYSRLMASEAPQQTVAPVAPAVWRWTVLIAISVAMFGNYYAYDAIAPVADLLQRSLGFSDTQIGTLNAIYSLPNIIMVLIGGLIVDRVRHEDLDAGVRRHLRDRCGDHRGVSAPSRSWRRVGSFSALAPSR